jgi:hypothetical protein
MARRIVIIVDPADKRRAIEVTVEFDDRSDITRPIESKKQKKGGRKSKRHNKKQKKGGNKYSRNLKKGGNERSLIPKEGGILVRQVAHDTVTTMVRDERDGFGGKSIFVEVNNGTIQSEVSRDNIRLVSANSIEMIQPAASRDGAHPVQPSPNGQGRLARLFDVFSEETVKEIAKKGVALLAKGFSLILKVILFLAILGYLHCS